MDGGCVFRGELYHRLIGRQPVNRSPRVCRGIGRTEPVYPDKVECVEKVSHSGGVGCVVGICPESVIDDEPGLAVSFPVAVTAASCRFVDIGKKLG